MEQYTTFDPSYPLFAIADKRGGWMITECESGDCALLYRSFEEAELFNHQSPIKHDVETIRSQEEFVTFLEELNEEDVPFILWCQLQRSYSGPIQLIDVSAALARYRR